MKALVYTAIGQLELQDVEMPKEDFLVKVIGSGVCGTDIKAFTKGHPFFTPPTVLGHECFGLVEKCPECSDFKPGDYVSIAPYCECGECDVCKRGSGQLCEHKSYLPYGAFQEYIGIPNDYIKKGVFKIESPDDVYALVEPLACVLNGIGHLNLKKESRVLIVGSGPMGTLFVMVFKDMGINVEVVEPSPNRKDFLENLGVKVYNQGEANYSNYDNIIVAVAKTELVEQCIEKIANAGVVLAFAGLPSGTIIKSDAFAVHYREVTLAGSFGYNIAHYKKALEMIKANPSIYEKLITHKMPLEKGLEAFEILQKAEALKLIFKLN